MDLPSSLSPEFDLKSELLSGRAKVLIKTDGAAFRDPETTKHTDCIYNYSPNQYVGNYKNWAFAQPVKDWCLVSYKGAYDNLEGLMEMGMLTPRWGVLPQQRGAIYQRIYICLKRLRIKV